MGLESALEFTLKMDSKLIEERLWEALYSESAKFSKFRNIGSNLRNYKCSVSNCDRNAYASGFCNAHYIRNIKGKSLSIPIRNRKMPFDICLECEIPLNKHGSGLGRCSKHFKSHRIKILKQTLVKLFGDKCSKCRNKYEYHIYDFHHTKRNKKFDIGSLLGLGSIKKISKEVSDCILICANCHRGIHYGNGL